jgi:hypothetical protein
MCRTDRSGSDATAASKAIFMMLMASGGKDAFEKSFGSERGRLANVETVAASEASHVRPDEKPERGPKCDHVHEARVASGALKSDAAC